jgi:hypothetical protein
LEVEEDKAAVKQEEAAPTEGAKEVKSEEATEEAGTDTAQDSEEDAGDNSERFRRVYVGNLSWGVR